MSRSNDWRWLAPRMAIRELLGGERSTRPVSRPCLAEIEPLGDRLMLSITTPIGKGPSPESVVTSLLKYSIGASATDASLLKIGLSLSKAVGSIEGIDLVKLDQFSHKLTESLMEIDTIFFKYADSLLKGEITGVKFADAYSKYETSLYKIDSLLTDLGGNDDDSPVFFEASQLKIAAESLWGAFKLFGSGVTMDLKIQDSFLKITDSFYKLQDGLYKLGDATLSKLSNPTGDVNYLQHKLDLATELTDSLADTNFKLQLLQFIGTATNFQDQLLNPGGDDGGDGGGGIILTEPNGVIALIGDIDDTIL